METARSPIAGLSLGRSSFGIRVQHRTRAPALYPASSETHHCGGRPSHV